MNQMNGMGGMAAMGAYNPWAYQQMAQQIAQMMAQQAQGINPSMGAGQNIIQPTQPQDAPFDGLTRVTGMQGAKAYQMPANSRAALFDDTEDVVIIKMTDGAGFPTYRRARLDWLPDEPESEYMTRADLRKELDVLCGGLDELKGLILDGKQSVSHKRGAGGDSDGK